LIRRRQSNGNKSVFGGIKSIAVVVFGLCGCADCYGGGALPQHESHLQFRAQVFFTGAQLTMDAPALWRSKASAMRVLESLCFSPERAKRSTSLDRCRPSIDNLGMPAATSNPRHSIGLDALILAVLGRAPAHGYAILNSLRLTSDGVFDLPEGTLYPILHRLERQGLLRARWQSVAGRERKVYALTKAGHSAVEAERSDWRRYSQAVNQILGGAT
jgi:DNA-binding PadR family transcriptional regulator